VAKSGSLHARRLALKSLPDKDAVKRLFDEIAPRFKERPGGYTRIMKLGKRQGDGAEVAIIEFVDYDYSQRQADKVSLEGRDQKKETLVEGEAPSDGQAPKAAGRRRDHRGRRRGAAGSAK
jgi:large subunit ribosomal protein L17